MHVDFWISLQLGWKKNLAIFYEIQNRHACYEWFFSANLHYGIIWIPGMKIFLLEMEIIWATQFVKDCIQIAITHIQIGNSASKITYQHAELANICWKYSQLDRYVHILNSGTSSGIWKHFKISKILQK